MTTERILSKRTNSRDGIFAKSSRCHHFVTKSTGLKSVKSGMSRHFSESRDSSYVSPAMCPECPGKDWRSKPFRLQSTPTEKRPKVHLQPCLVPSWCGASRTICDCCWSWAGTDLGSAGYSAIIVLAAPSRCDLFDRLSEKRESMPFLCVVPPQNLCFVVPTLVLHLPLMFNRN